MLIKGYGDILANRCILMTFHNGCLPDIQIVITIKAIKKYVASIETATEINSMDLLHSKTKC